MAWELLAKSLTATRPTRLVGALHRHGVLLLQYELCSV